MTQTAAELMALALEEMNKATISVDEWCSRIRHGYKGEPYNYEETHNYEAQKAMEAAAALPAPAPPVPRPPAAGRGQRVVYFSDVNVDACRRFAALGPGYTARLTADPNPAYMATDVDIAILKSKGGRVESWCDCHTTFLPAAKQMALTRGLDGWGGEYESNGAWDHLIEYNATDAIGNPGALSRAPEVPDRLALAIAESHGSMRLIGEVMNPNPAYSAQGVNISSACFYVDRDLKDGGYIPLEAYSVMPAGMRATCSVYAGGRMSAEDWDTFAAWTKP